MKMKILLAILLSVMCAGAEACTNLIVGKGASADGSVIVTYNADDYGSFGFLCHYPAAKHKAGTTRSVYDWETNNYRGEIEEAAETYNVIGNMNEHQLTVVETTFGGREELVDPNGLLDYGSLIAIALQRARTAREAISVITGLVDKYGYASEGESFTLADPNEAWIMEMIGKGPDEKGAVWVAVRIPDDCVSAHANQSRIRRFPLKDKNNCLYSPDVISYARKKGYFKGKDAEFSFSEAYAPADFSALRFCEARVWSFFNRCSRGFEQYLPYASGMDPKAEPMPLYVVPAFKLSVQDVKNMMRDHYEGTPFAMNNDPGQGAYEAPYRPTPLTWEVDGKTYFNERPISTQQTAFTLVAQMRSWLPNYVGGVLWFGCDDPNMIAYTPVYCCTDRVPECYSDQLADAFTFSFRNAFWVCNWVSNMIYPRYSQLFGELESVRNRLESDYNSLQGKVEKDVMDMIADDEKGEAEARRYLTDYTDRVAQGMLNSWMDLAKYLIVKYNDQAVKREKDGVYERTDGGYALPVIRPGYPERYRRQIVKETGDRFLVPKYGE
ncbi:MAG: C69 family dipeptidase [Clostridium sp.]|nr:C69 family dipeptidase [Clostridium sp.]